MPARPEITGPAMAISRFYWMIESALAGCSRPGGAESRPEALEDDLQWLWSRGIGAVLSLTETPLDQDALDRCELASLHLPIVDQTAPRPDQFACALDFIDRQRAQSRAVAVHCKMGQGRTGTILAAHLVRAGIVPEEALRRLRAICPGAISSPEQQRALEAFAALRDWMI
jgi:atypical dual specificity phosphatase